MDTTVKATSKQTNKHNSIAEWSRKGQAYPTHLKCSSQAVYIQWIQAT